MALSKSGEHQRVVAVKAHQLGAVPDLDVGLQRGAAQRPVRIPIAPGESSGEVEGVTKMELSRFLLARFLFVG